MRRRKHGYRREDSYVCPSCGETIAIAVDRSVGDEQEFVDDLPRLLPSERDPCSVSEGDEVVRVWAEADWLGGRVMAQRERVDLGAYAMS